ncbi:hypothetical protein E1B28_003385 [Marasmius oreades]|uniref:Uncharacterized protein n=1 Tax=Marasmius oreades TaxID=181124 RepID=A0A9P7UND1_9AGAR|nr:uncharacterized protein E1B28_003385 [Marasmius oreades]KAG7085849.1 hypothetical protein E1B28_003385 [Marasmius oreades]
MSLILLLSHIASRQPDTSASEPSICDDTRTTAEIIWTCLSVIFLCAWTSVHPNVPNLCRSQHWALVFWDEAKITFVALIAPELMVLWSIRQWLAARKMAKGYRVYGWTKTHAFFALMGGFAFYDANGKFLYHLWDPRFSQHFDRDRNGEGRQKGKLDELSVSSQTETSCLLECCAANSLINITEEDISKLSSMDTIGKLATIIQTLSFIASCIARGVKGLAITELEFLALGSAALNLVSYSFWWNKPYRVRFPVHVQVADKFIPRPQAEPAQQAGSTYSLITRPIITLKAWILEVSDAFACRIEKDYCDPSSHEPVSLCFCLTLPLLAVTRLFTYAFNGDAAEAPQPECGNIFSASTFEEARSPLTYALTYSSAVLLGVFHCIPIMLNYRDFSGHIKDHHLWTVFALIMTSLPLVVGFVHVFNILRATDRRTEGSIPMKGFLVLMFVLSYSTTRIALMILAAKQLVDLPPSALQKAEWTDLIPHLDI